MMKVTFRREADADLRGIAEWYEAVAPGSLAGILSDIYRSIDQLIDFPRSGTKVPGSLLRRIVSRKHHFKIPYEIGDGAIIIVGIFRYQNRQS
ncbi:MAG: type II toxin-antitoxin system RelE/ParE family toxin [Novosphingobium sp.]